MNDVIFTAGIVSMGQLQEEIVKYLTTNLRKKEDEDLIILCLL